MPFSQMRLFFRLISKNREVYFLKIISLSIAFSCSILILLFTINEFGYDRFHRDHTSVFRVLQRNNLESFNGNRLSNRIQRDVFAALKAVADDSLIVSRVKLMDKVNVLAGDKIFKDAKFYTADPGIGKIFSFDLVDGSLEEFHDKKNTLILSSHDANKYFGRSLSAGERLQVYTLGDTLDFTVAAVYEDFPQNSHEAFNSFIRFDSARIRSLNFNPADVGVYVKTLHGNEPYFEELINDATGSEELTYQLQSLSAIYFGPRVMGEDSKHGDHYSVLILICITTLILFLAITSFVNLTTLTLPHRAKELAVKKLAGTSQSHLIAAFTKESVLIVGLSFLLGVAFLKVASNWSGSVLPTDLGSLFYHGNVQLILGLTVLFVIITLAPLGMTFRFTRASPHRLLSSDKITFPQLKRTIMFLQLGISIFLIVASMVIKRQINFSLLKEPGRNHDQIVYVSYPKDLTNDGLINLRATWKKINANVVDVMATSQLPDRVNSKELNSDFYFMSVDRGFKDFFDLQMLQGNWFKANDGDSIIIVNEAGNRLLVDNEINRIGVFMDFNGQFSQPEKPTKINTTSYFNYNFLCIRILEVDIRRTVGFLENYFKKDGHQANVSFLNKRFEEWLRYQDKLNALSDVLAIISGLLSCCAIYGLSISIVRDKLKQIAIHKLCGANTINVTVLLVKEFASQMMMAVIIFGPLTYIILKEILRNFAYATEFSWLDPLVPLAYCIVVITLLCGFQTLSLNREDLSSALKS